jgi:hypothetical protein
VQRALLHRLVDPRDELAVFLAAAEAWSPDCTALSRRRKWVFTELVRRRFSSHSRSVRRIRFFCEAILAIESGESSAA